MNSLVKKIEGFLDIKNITWIEKRTYDSAKTIFREAVDSDFLDQSFQKVLLRNSKGKIYHKNLVVTEKLFLVFDEKLRKLEKNLSDEWISYQRKAASDENYESLDEETKKRVDNFRKYLNDDQYAWD